MKSHPVFRFASFCAGLLFCATSLFGAADALTWHAKQNSVDAQIQNWNLPKLLEAISDATGWQIYVEPGTAFTVSVKFKSLSTDEALRRLLGEVNYVREETNSISKLFVYRTQVRAATQLIGPNKKTLSDKKKYLIPNELIVRLNRNSKLSIEELAKLLGAKITGRDDRNKVYRLQFENEAAANAARALLAGNSEVASVESNYRVDRPSPHEMMSQAPGGGGSLVNPPSPSADGPTIGMIDTAYQSQNCLDGLALPGIAVAGNANPPMDSPTHGTGIYETMVQAMGNSPVKIRPVDVYGNNPETTTFEVSQGIIKAINSGANPINLSLGGTGDSDFLHNLIREAYAKGIVFVAAAGNQPGTALTFPAAYPEVLAVTASNADGQIEPYANTGSFVDMAASGTSTVCLNGQFWTTQGTSVSTANVTGRIAALMAQQHITAQQAAQQVVGSKGK